MWKRSGERHQFQRLQTHDHAMIPVPWHQFSVFYAFQISGQKSDTATREARFTWLMVPDTSPQGCLSLMKKHHGGWEVDWGKCQWGRGQRPHRDLEVLLTHPPKTHSEECGLTFKQLLSQSSWELSWHYPFSIMPCLSLSLWYILKAKTYCIRDMFVLPWSQHCT